MAVPRSRAARRNSHGRRRRSAEPWSRTASRRRPSAAGSPAPGSPRARSRCPASRAGRGPARASARERAGASRVRASRRSTGRGAGESGRLRTSVRRPDGRRAPAPGSSDGGLPRDSRPSRRGCSRASTSRRRSSRRPPSAPAHPSDADAAAGSRRSARPGRRGLGARRRPWNLQLQAHGGKLVRRRPTASGSSGLMGLQYPEAATIIARRSSRRPPTARGRATHCARKLDLRSSRTSGSTSR